MDIQIISDEIWADGHLVGILVQEGTPASVMQKFVYGVNNGTLFQETSDVEAIDRVVDEVYKRAKGGLVRFEDVKKTAELLKQGEQE